MSVSAASPSSPAVRPLTGVEDLIIFFGLTKAYRKYVQLPVPSTFEHLIADLPGPSLYGPSASPPTKSASSSSPSSSAQLVAIAAKETLLVPLSYSSMPPPLQVRALTAVQAERVLSLSEEGELGLVSAELRAKEERLSRLAEERRAKKDERKTKRSDKKRKQSVTAAHSQPHADEAVKRVPTHSPLYPHDFSTARSSSLTVRLVSATVPRR